LIACFRLIVTPERIVQTGKKKLVLDHLIVQKMDDEEGGEDVNSILTYGAKALFEDDQAAKDITCQCPSTRRTYLATDPSQIPMRMFKS
jgi:hypothetical protein